MKVLLVATSSLAAGNLFGTERVVLGLSRHLASHGIEAHAAAHASAETNGLRPYSDMQSCRHVLPPLPVPSRQQHFRVHNGAPGFAALVDRVRPDVVQLHGLSAAASNRAHLAIAREQGCKTVLWHNVPGITCLQTGLLRHGTTPCDGEIRVTRCTECRLRAFSLPAPAAWLVARTGVGRASQILPRRLAAVAGARWFTGQFKQATQSAFANLDAIRVGAEWARDVLIRNDVRDSRLHLIRPGVELKSHGEEVAGEAPDIWRKQGTKRPLRLIYWGRIHTPKGVHTLWQALALLPDLDVELAIVGDADKDNAYCQELRARAAVDSRIRLAGYVSAEQVLAVLRTADVAMIPSRWHETGPITVYEARAAGLPILTTDRGGNGELCRDDPGSRLFPAEDASALAQLLAQIAADPALLQNMRAGVQAPRTMADVAAEACQLYRELCA